MSDFERISRIPEANTPFAEPKVSFNITLTESEYLGLHSLIEWLGGFQAAGTTGRVPGYFELVMHFRQLTSAIDRERSKAKEACVHEWVPFADGSRACKKCSKMDFPMKHGGQDEADLDRSDP